MKARLLKKLLNNTGYSISNHEKYIAVGSPLCHDLISVDKESLNVKYALDTFRKGRASLVDKSSTELLFIWDKLHELIESGEIKEIIDGKDLIENPLPVFTVENGEVFESVTDFYGWPNTDDNGICMYENTHFPTKQQAIDCGIKEYKAGEEYMLRRIEEIENDLSKAKSSLEQYRGYITHLRVISNQTSN